MAEIAEMLEYVQLNSAKGYKFMCANTPNACVECSQKLVAFVTQDLEEAYNHSLRNSVAIWISKD